MSMNIRHIREIALRLFVYALSLAFCLAAWSLALGLLFAGCRASGDTAPLAVLRWDVETARPAPYTVELFRGESLVLEPRYLSYGAAIDLTDVYEVVLRYRSADMAAGTYHLLQGSVHDAAGGRVRILWTPAAAAIADAYTFTIAAKSADGETLRAFGGIRLRGTVQGDPEDIVPVVAEVFDWSLIIEHLHLEAAPFAGPGDLLDIEQRFDAHDILIQEALASAPMGGDISGVSTQAVVTATRGRLFPAAADVPADMEAIVWDSSLYGGSGGYRHGSVDLSAIEAAILDLQLSAATVPYVDSEILAVRDLLDGKVDVADWEAGSAELQLAIGDAAAMANMGGDIIGVSTQAVVVGIWTIPVDELTPGAGQDGYGLKYDHASGSITLGPVATEGTSISNILTLISTAQATDVGSGQIGLYRIIRPGNLPSAVINVNGAEIAWFDLLGMTMRQGSIHLLGDDLEVNPAAYDGTAALPAYTWAAQRNLGKYRFSTGAGYAEGFAVDGSRIWYWDANGIHLEDGKSITGSSAERDPLSVHKSTTYAAWTHAGGTYTTNAVIATSPLLSNGVQRVEFQKAGPLDVVVESSHDGTSWETFAASANPSYVRISAVIGLPIFDDPDTAVSNLVAYSWTRPDLVGETTDTAGQQLLLDYPETDRAATPRAYVDNHVANAVATVTPVAWSDYPAAAPVRLDNNKLMLGGGWSLYRGTGLGYLSYDGLVVANNGGLIMTAQGDIQGLEITGVVSDGTNVTINVSTNGVTSQPIIQWTPSLSIIDWQSLTPVSETYPGTTNGAYQIIVELPATPAWFRAVSETGAARIDFHAPTYAEGFRVSARPIVSTDPPSSHTPAYAGHQLIMPGATNRIYTAFGPTSSDWQLTWEGVAP